MYKDILSFIVRWNEINYIILFQYLLMYFILRMYTSIANRELNLEFKLLHSLCYFIALWLTSTCNILFFFVYCTKGPYVYNEQILVVFIPFSVMLIIGLFQWEHMPVSNWFYKSIQSIILFYFFANIAMLKHYLYEFMKLPTRIEWIVIVIMVYVVNLFICEPLISKYIVYLNTRLNIKRY